jgi:hypothetical protein
MTDMQQPNPYAPPAASLDSEPKPSSRVRKPISAWLMQLLAIVAIVGPLVGLYRIFARMAWSDSLGLSSALKVALVNDSWRAAAVAVALGTLVGTHRRAAYGRWLGLVLLGAIITRLGYDVFVLQSGSWQSVGEYRRAANAAELAGQLICFCPLVWWFYTFGFSVKARKFFQARPKADSAAP